MSGWRAPSEPLLGPLSWNYQSSPLCTSFLRFYSLPAINTAPAAGSAAIGLAKQRQAAEDSVKEIERRHTITRRWSPMDADFIEAWAFLKEQKIQTCQRKVR